MKKISLIIVLILLIVTAGFLLIIDPNIILKPLQSFGKKSNLPRNFTECLAAGYPVQKTYPRRCIGPHNQFFIEEVPRDTTTNINIIKKPATALYNIIQVTTPRPNGKITSPLTITGQARGSWFFEASFPIILKDANGVVLAKTSAEAKDEWMTENFVPFSATITFPVPTTTTGTLILRKDNPSGLSKNDAELEIPVQFKN